MRKSIPYGLYCNILLYCHTISNTGGSSRTRADVLSFDPDDWPADAVEVIVVILVYPLFGSVYSQGAGKPRDLSIV